MRRICVHYDTLGYPQRGQTETEGPIPAILEQSAVAGIVAVPQPSPAKLYGIDSSIIHHCKNLFVYRSTVATPYV